MRPWLTLATTTPPFSFTLSTDQGSTDYLITTSLTNTGSFFLQGDKRHGGNSSAGVVARRQIAEVLVHSLRSEADLRKTFELVAVTGPVQENLELLLAALGAAPEGSSDAVHAGREHASRRGTQRVTNDARPSRSGSSLLTEGWKGIGILVPTAVAATRPHVRDKPRLLSDNGPSYIAGELAEWIGAQGMSHARGAPFHPQTQGKIERWHQTLKNPGVAGELLPTQRLRTPDRGVHRALQPPAHAPLARA